MSTGTFTFQNGTSSTAATQVICYRDPANTQWWYITLPAWTLFFMVPILAFGLGIWFRADYRSRDMAVMVIVASAGYCVYYFVKQVSLSVTCRSPPSDVYSLQQLPNQTDIVSAVGAFVIGLACLTRSYVLKLTLIQQRTRECLFPALWRLW
jgi:hypothetical protein